MDCENTQMFYKYDVTRQVRYVLSQLILQGAPWIRAESRFWRLNPHMSENRNEHVPV